MRFDGRLAFSAVGLCLPTLSVIALGVYFYLDKVPAIVKAEHARVREIYRETAQAIRQRPEAYHLREKLPPEWKSCGQMKPGKWGFQPIPLKRVTWVWYEENGMALVGMTRYEPETDFRLGFAAFGSFILLVLVAATVFGIRFFVRYTKSRDDFLAATAHDLTTPLVGLRMTIGRNDDEAKRLNERMLLIVGNIREFLKLGGRRKKPELGTIDVVALCREAYGLFAADYADSFAGAVEFDLAPLQSPHSAPSLFASADETMTLQILWNLFGNDLKYAAPYGRVSVRFSVEGDFARIEFADEGQGMTPSQMRRAFDRYYRAKTVLESGKGGFGIGLCASREFARAMGGDLRVRGNEPKGCVFSLLLPRSAP